MVGEQWGKIFIVDCHVNCHPYVNYFFQVVTANSGVMVNLVSKNGKVITMS